MTLARPLVLLLVVVLGVWLRVDRVGEWSLSGDEVYTLDEARHCAALMRGEPGTISRGGRAPSEDHDRWAILTNGLFYFITGGCVLWLGDTPLAVRLPALTAGLLALVVLPFLVRRLWGPAFARLLLVFLALNPFHVSMSRYGRYETLVFLFSGIAILSVCIWMRRPRSTWLALAAAAGLAGAACHLCEALLCIALAVFVLSRVRLRGPILVALLVALAGAALWFSSDIRWLVGIIERQATRHAHSPGVLRMFVSQAYNLGPLLGLAAVVGFWTQFRSRSDSRWLILVSIVIPVIVICVLSRWHDMGIRYFSPVHPCVFFLAVHGAMLFCRPDRPRRVVWPALVVVLSQVPLLVSNQLDGQRYDYQGAAEYLREVSGETDLVLAESHGLLKYYTRREGEEIPKLFEEIEARVQSRADRTAFLVLLRQRGQLIHPQSGRLEAWIEQHEVRHQLFGRRRWDDRIYRFEIGVYEVRCDEPAERSGSAK